MANMDNDILRIRKAKRVMKKYLAASCDDAKIAIIINNGYSCYEALEFDAIELENFEVWSASPTGFVR